MECIWGYSEDLSDPRSLWGQGKDQLKRGHCGHIRATGENVCFYSGSASLVKFSPNFLRGLLWSLPLCKMLTSRSKYRAGVLPLQFISPEFYLNEHVPARRKFKPLPPTTTREFEITIFINVYPVVKSYYPLIEGSAWHVLLGPMLIQATETVKKCPEHLPFIVCAFLDLPNAWSLIPNQWPRSSSISRPQSLAPRWLFSLSSF